MLVLATSSPAWVNRALWTRYRMPRPSAGLVDRTTDLALIGLSLPGTRAAWTDRELRSVFDPGPHRRSSWRDKGRSHKPPD